MQSPFPCLNGELGKIQQEADWQELSTLLTGSSDWNDIYV